MDRRRRNLLLAAGTALGLGAGGALRHLFRRAEPERGGRYGPLAKDPESVLNLPAGFEYRVLSRAGEPMTDGYRVPAAFDGMACFPGPDGTLALLRNHENIWSPDTGPYSLGQAAPPEAFDPRAQGAVTRLVVRADALERVSENLVLCGTLRNCAGGTSPWGWLSCEESIESGHGWVFACPADASRVVPPRAIRAYGRCRHEAAAVHLPSLVAYLTEDEPDSCLYRFVPTARDRPFEGKLEALTVVGAPGLDTGRDLGPGWTRDVAWVPVDDPEAAQRPLREQAHARGAASFARGEGLWIEGDRVVFCATSGGPASRGQVFGLDLAGGLAADRLALLAQSAGPDHLRMPDNVTLGPGGEAYLAEDSPLDGRQRVLVLSADGNLHPLAENARAGGEIAGVCFAPGGRTLFLNLYSEGLTLAVRGPFARG